MATIANIAFIWLCCDGLTILLQKPDLAVGELPDDPRDLSYHKKYRNLVVLVVCEHILLIVKFALAHFIADCPEHIEERLEARKAKEVRSKISAKTKKIQISNSQTKQTVLSQLSLGLFQKTGTQNSKKLSKLFTIEYNDTPIVPKVKDSSLIQTEKPKKTWDQVNSDIQEGNTDKLKAERADLKKKIIEPISEGDEVKVIDEGDIAINYFSKPNNHKSLKDL